MRQGSEKFTLPARLLHWVMAILILAMLYIGIGMVSTITPTYHRLLSLHESLGIGILVLAALRLLNRVWHPPPALPPDLPSWQVALARSSHVLLYALMFAQPLVGWGMLSAADYPIKLFGRWGLPPILPHDVHIFAVLRATHTALGFAFFAVFLAHLGAALYHATIRKDGVLESMT